MTQSSQLDLSDRSTNRVFIVSSSTSAKAAIQPQVLDKDLVGAAAISAIRFFEDSENFVVQPVDFLSVPHLINLLDRFRSELPIHYFIVMNDPDDLDEEFTLLVNRIIRITGEIPTISYVNFLMYIAPGFSKEDESSDTDHILSSESLVKGGYFLKEEVSPINHDDDEGGGLNHD